MALTHSTVLLFRVRWVSLHMVPSSSFLLLLLLLLLLLMCLLPGPALQDDVLFLSLLAPLLVVDLDENGPRR